MREEANTQMHKMPADKANCIFICVHLILICG